MKSFPYNNDSQSSLLFYKQPDAMDYGPACLRMVAKHYKKNISLQTLRERVQIGNEG